MAEPKTQNELHQENMDLLSGLASKFATQNELNDAARELMVSTANDKNVHLQEQVDLFVSEGEEQWLNAIDSSAKQLNIFVDNDAGDGGDGSSWGAAFNSLEIAMDSLKDGGSYQINLKGGQTFSINDGATSKLYTPLNVDIMWRSDYQNRATLLISHFVSSDGSVYPRWRISPLSSLRCAFVYTDVTLEMESDVTGTVLNHSGFLYPSWICDLTVGFIVSTLTVAPNLRVITPYYTAHKLNLLVRSSSVSGGGDIVDSGHSQPINVFAHACSIATDTYLLSYLPASRGNLLTNYGGAQLSRA